MIGVTSLTLSLETKGGICVPIIPKNTPLPATANKIFTTIEDNQKSISLKLYQGERSMALDNILLGSFSLTGLPPAPRLTHQIEVKFDINVNGIIIVTTKDLKTQKETQITIESTFKLTKEEVDEISTDAEKSYDDQRKKEKAELINKAKLYAYEYDRLNKNAKIQTSQHVQENNLPIEYHFHITINNNIENMHNSQLQQGTSNSFQINSISESSNEKLLEILQSINEIKNKVNMSENELEILKSDIEQIEQQQKSEHPNKSKIVQNLSSMLSVIMKFDESTSTIKKIVEFFSGI